ncbi:MAG: hypothetical protein JNM99_10055 [Verrucomicrobiaceae bacterium]|nr:hypothetical protein [Verrucomicrobiaceae bacterium]
MIPQWFTDKLRSWFSDLQGPLNKIWEFAYHGGNIVLSLLAFCMSPVGFFVGLVAVFYTQKDALFAAVHSQLVYITSLIPSYSTDYLWVGQLNRVFPLVESLLIVQALISLRIATVAFRIVKSWVPTVS